MSERRIVLLFALATTAAFVAIGCSLTIFKVGGSADIEAFGQKFSSSNVGISILLVAAGLLIFTIKELTPGSVPSELLDSSATGEAISWKETIDGIDSLVLQLTASDGFRPDVVIGICGGGLMVADLVAKRLGHIPCLSIWSDRHAARDGSSFEGSALPVNSSPFDELFKKRSVTRVLLVDDVIYSGSTLAEGVDFLRARSAEIRRGAVKLKTAALFTLTSATVQSDFCVYSDTKRRKMMPSSDRLRRLSG